MVTRQGTGFGAAAARLLTRNRPPVRPAPRGRFAVAGTDRRASGELRNDGL